MPSRRDENAVVHRFPFNGDNARLVDGIRHGQPAAVAHFYALFAEKVQRILFRILGSDSELEDTVHDTFVRALESIHTLRDPEALGSWIIGVAIFTARIRIQRRHRRRWLQLFSPDDLPDRKSPDCAPEVGEALRAVSRVLDKIPTHQRIAVVLRLAEGMTMPEAAQVCGVSLSTFKRRFVRGEKIFQALVAKEPALKAWTMGGSDGA